MTMSKAEKSKSNEISMLHTLTITDLNVVVPEAKAAPVGFSMWVRALMQNWRQGTVGCKGRSDVNKTNKKPWKQKGTGRARAGSARSPLWRGGGVIFGPQPRVRVLKVSKKQKNAVLRDLFFEYLEQGKIAWLNETLNNQKPSTAIAYAALKSVGLQEKKITLFLPTDDQLTYASFVNLPNVQVLCFDQPNAYDLAHGKNWVFFKRDLDMFKEMVSQWR